MVVLVNDMRPKRACLYRVFYSGIPKAHLPSDLLEFRALAPGASAAAGHWRPVGGAKPLASGWELEQPAICARH